MKTLEDRLREKAIFADTNAWTTSEVVLLSDALAIVADAPRIYRGEEILSHEGALFWCVDEKEVVEVYQGRVRYADAAEYQAGAEQMTYHGPLPTNSPSEG